MTVAHLLENGYREYPTAGAGSAYLFRKFDDLRIQFIDNPNRDAYKETPEYAAIQKTLDLINERSFSKAFVDASGKKRYFITVDMNRFGVIPFTWFTPSMQVTINNRSVLIQGIQWYNTENNVEVTPNHDIKEAEAFFETAFVALGAEDYD